jgi:DNA modification methylase
MKGCFAIISHRCIFLRIKISRTCGLACTLFSPERNCHARFADFGREKTVQAYIDHTMLALRESWRVLGNDGILFWNICDSYYGSGRGIGSIFNPRCSTTPTRGLSRAKSLCLIPERVAIAAQAAGWIVRSRIIWHKPNCVPNSVRDRCTRSYEEIFMLTKRQNYFLNKKEAVEPSVCWQNDSLGGGVTPSTKDGMMKYMTMRHSNKVGSSQTEKRVRPIGEGPKGDAMIAAGIHGKRSRRLPPIGNTKHQALGNATLVGNRMEMKLTRNSHDVWTINTRPHSEAHTAMWPEALVERMIRISTKEGDTVLDSFAGSGTTGLVAE